MCFGLSIGEKQFKKDAEERKVMQLQRTITCPPTLQFCYNSTFIMKGEQVHSFNYCRFYLTKYFLAYSVTVGAMFYSLKI